MSFSSDVKRELSKITGFNKEIFEAELCGYLISGNCVETENTYKIVTENEFNIEHLYKILSSLEIDYDPDIKGKCFVAEITKNERINNLAKNYANQKKENLRYVIKGAFLGAGYLNDPNKNYYLEIFFTSEKIGADFVDFCLEYGIKCKTIKTDKKFQAYIKESEEISKFLALIGANKSVLQFEDIRVLKHMANSVNRKVNCETANLSKTIDAALKQIDDINKIKNAGKYEQLPANLKIVAELRIQNPDLSLQDLGKKIEPNLRKISC